MSACARLDPSVVETTLAGAEGRRAGEALAMWFRQRLRPVEWLLAGYANDFSTASLNPSGSVSRK